MYNPHDPSCRATIHDFAVKLATRAHDPAWSVEDLTRSMRTVAALVEAHAGDGERVEKPVGEPTCR